MPDPDPDDALVELDEEDLLDGLDADLYETGWRFVDEQAVEWGFRSLARAQRLIARRTAQADEELDRIRRWLSDRVRGAERVVALQELALESYALAVRERTGGKVKTVETPWGRITTTGPGPKAKRLARIVDPDAFVAAQLGKAGALQLAALQARYPLLQITARPVGLAALYDAVVATGEIPTWVELHDRATTAKAHPNSPAEFLPNPAPGGIVAPGEETVVPPDLVEQLAASIEQATQIQPVCGDVAGPHRCDRPAGHEGSHQTDGAAWERDPADLSDADLAQAIVDMVVLADEAAAEAAAGDPDPGIVVPEFNRPARRHFESSDPPEDPRLGDTWTPPAGPEYVWVTAEQAAADDGHDPEAGAHWCPVTDAPTGPCPTAPAAPTQTPEEQP